MYAEALGVDPSLETLAQWVSWADSSHYAQDDATAQYNLNQFWTAKSALDAATTQAHMIDIVYLDGLSHRVMGYIYMRQLVTADPSDMARIAGLEQQQFAQSSDEFSQTGHDMMASDDNLRAGGAASDASQVAANYVDDSIVTAIKDQASKTLDSAGSLITGASSLASLLSNPLVLVGLACAVGYVVWKSK